MSYMKTYAVPNQVIIVAAGESSRFFPFNKDGHKSTFSLMGKPILSHTIDALLRVGMKKICIVKSPDDKKIEQIVQGYDASVVSCVNQPSPLGMADALLQVTGLQDKPVFVLNPQQMSLEVFIDQLKIFSQSENITSDSVILFSRVVSDMSKYGILGLSERKVTKVVEKPTDTTGLSNEGIIGVYIFPPKFLSFLATQKQEEYQLEAALNAYAQKEDVFSVPMKTTTVSLKYPWDMFEIVHSMFQHVKEKRIHPSTYVHPTAVIEGPVVIEEGAKVYEYAIIKGPCYIGKDVVIGSYCKVRNESVLEEGVELTNAVEVRGSILAEGMHIHSGYIGDSIIGKHVRIGGGFITANKRLDRKTISVMVKGKLVDTKRNGLGCFIGDNAHIGIHCGTNPGRVISPSAEVAPGTIVVKNI